MLHPTKPKSRKRLIAASDIRIQHFAHPVISNGFPKRRSKDSIPVKDADLN
jgi:hypothetical protein